MIGWKTAPMRLAASLAFYTMLSLAPLLVLAVKAVGTFFSEDAAREQVHHYLSEVMGNTAGDAVTKMIGPLTQPGSGFIATTLSVIVLLVSASAVFGELQDSLNTIWEVKPKPGRGIIGIIQERFLSFMLVIGVCFLLLVSLIITTTLTGLTGYLGGQHPSAVWHVINFVLSMTIVTCLFAMIFKYLPDVQINWGDVWHGAITTGVLFTIGKFLLSWYLARQHDQRLCCCRVAHLGAALGLLYVSNFVFWRGDYPGLRPSKPQSDANG